MCPVSGYFDTVFAVDGTVTSIPDAIQSNGSVSYNQGFGILYSTAVASGGLNFPRAQFNQLMNDITTAVQLIQQNGCSDFITTTMNGGTPYSYNKGATVLYGGIVYISQVASNTTIPGASPDWQPLGAVASILFSGGTSTGSANTQAVTTAQGNFANTANNIITWTAGYSNTGAATLNPDSVGALPLKKASSSGVIALQSGDLVVGIQYIGISDGTNIQVINPSTTVATTVGNATNLKASVTSASATATWTADEVVVKTALGASAVLLSSYSEAINLGTTGAGGMDTGSAPASGYVALYAIFGTSGTSIVACNVTTSSGPVYGGSHMPSGYTYSGLLGIWPTNGSSQFPIGYQNGHTVSFAGINVLNVSGGSGSLTYTSVGLSGAVPPSAKSVSGIIGGGISGNDIAIAVAADANGTGEQIAMMPDSTATPLEGFMNASVFSLVIITSQTIYYKVSETSCGPRINVTSYSF